MAFRAVFQPLHWSFAHQESGGSWCSSPHGYCLRAMGLRQLSARLFGAIVSGSSADAYSLPPASLPSGRILATPLVASNLGWARWHLKCASWENQTRSRLRRNCARSGKSVAQGGPPGHVE
jgi:hypothetical protein